MMHPLEKLLTSVSIAAIAVMAFATTPVLADEYPLKTCVVTGEKLDSDAYDYHYQGRLVRFCCKSCIEKFNKDPQKFLKAIDAAEKKAADAKPAKKS